MYLNTWAQQKHYKQSPMTSQSTGESTDDTQIEDKDLVFWISKQLLQITKGETNNKMISKDYSQVNKKSENTNDSEKFEKLLKLSSNQRKSRQNNRLQTGQRVIPAALAETGGGAVEMPPVPLEGATVQYWGAASFTVPIESWACKPLWLKNL